MRQSCGDAKRQSVNLDREFRIAEKSYGTDHLDLVLGGSSAVVGMTANPLGAH
jgi:hypothetical protein